MLLYITDMDCVESKVIHLLAMSSLILAGEVDNRSGTIDMLRCSKFYFGAWIRELAGGFFHTTHNRFANFWHNTGRLGGWKHLVRISCSGLTRVALPMWPSLNYDPLTGKGENMGRICQRQHWGSYRPRNGNCNWGLRIYTDADVQASNEQVTMSMTKQ